jgi:preprotein translocase subunit Sec61beta
MARDSKIRMPSGQGGLTRYFDEYHSRVTISPGSVIVLCLIVALMVILLHYIGGALLQ